MVNDDLMQAMRLSLDAIGVVLGPSGAAGLAQSRGSSSLVSDWRRC